jgi:hypothetical protein
MSRAMIAFEEAERIAQQKLKSDSERTKIELQLMPEHTIEKDYGWVFFYQSAAFMRTRDFRVSLLGNAPFLVRKADGRVIILGTARSTEWYLKEYERGRWA